ncbi:MAG: hypothetical protein KDB21_09150 [Acidimicrobiales bacterium]|nr:hypothetical protein [Acidimicrobiales bacterium]
MYVEIDRPEAFDDHLAATGTLVGVVVQGLDLRSRTTTLVSVPCEGAVLLGCEVEPAAVERLYAGGALLYPRFPDLPFHPFRPTLYRPEDLLSGYRGGDPASLDRSADAQVYRWYQQHRRRPAVLSALAQRIHDHAIDDALDELLASDGRGQRLVAIMGGHGIGRDHPRFAEVARLGRLLTRRGFFVASGGGPGAMEATNLGAWFAPHDDDALDEALALLATVPSFEPVHRWIDVALEVRRRWPPIDPDVPTSLGVPTWHYGHEPSNLFASHHAKYFANSIREDGLLAIATAGVVFAPGSAGTIQEVFQDAAQNHYRSFGVVSPMVFLDRRYWTEDKPVYPLLAQLADGHDYADKLGAYDDAASVVEHIERHRP